MKTLVSGFMIGMLVASCGQENSSFIDATNLEGKARITGNAIKESQVGNVQSGLGFIAMDNSYGYLDVRGVGDAGWARNGRAIADGDGFANRLNEIDPKKELFIGDVNFINWESTLGDYCTYTKTQYMGAGTFSFISQPSAIEGAIEFGYNLIGTTNNHTRDCYRYNSAQKLSGENSERATLEYMNNMMGTLSNDFIHHGIAESIEKRISPKILEIEKQGKIIKIAFNSVYFHSHDNPGYCDAYSNCYRHVDSIMRALKNTDADLKFLSIHSQGRRGYQRLSSVGKRFIEEFGGDIVFGHGTHQIQPVRALQKPNGDYGILFEDFGNFLHPGVSGHGDNMQGRVLFDLENLKIAQVQLMTIRGKQYQNVNSDLRASARSAVTIPSNLVLQKVSSGLVFNGYGEEMQVAFTSLVD